MFPHIADDLFPDPVAVEPFEEPTEPPEEPAFVAEARAAIKQRLAELDVESRRRMLALDTEAPASCNDSDTESCCQTVMHDIQEYVYYVFQTIPGLDAVVKYRWESWVVQDQNMTGDEKDDISKIRFACRSEFTFKEYNDDSQLVRDDKWYAEVPKVFEMKCEKPFLRKYLPVLRLDTNKQDTIGLCFNRKLKRGKTYTDKHTRVIGSSYSARRGIMSGDMTQQTTINPGENICMDYVDMSGGASTSGEAGSSDGEFAHGLHMMAYIADFDDPQGGSGKIDPAG